MLTDLSTRVTLEKPLQGIHDPQYINANFVSVAAAAAAAAVHLDDSCLTNRSPQPRAMAMGTIDPSMYMGLTMIIGTL